MGCVTMGWDDKTWSVLLGSNLEELRDIRKGAIGSRLDKARRLCADEIGTDEHRQDQSG